MLLQDCLKVLGVGIVAGPTGIGRYSGKRHILFRCGGRKAEFLTDTLDDPVQPLLDAMDHLRLEGGWAFSADYIERDRVGRRRSRGETEDWARLFRFAELFGEELFDGLIAAYAGDPAAEERSDPFELQAWTLAHEAAARAAALGLPPVTKAEWPAPSESRRFWWLAGGASENGRVVEPFNMETRACRCRLAVSEDGILWVLAPPTATSGARGLAAIWNPSAQRLTGPLTARRVHDWIVGRFQNWKAAQERKARDAQETVRRQEEEARRTAAAEKAGQDVLTWLRSTS